MTRWFGPLLGAVVVAGLVALSAGASGWRWTALADALSGEPIAAELRAPRVVLAAVVGAGLAIAGFAMQTVLRNDLADPYILGLSGGASTGAVASLALWPTAPPGFLAALGAAGAALVVYGLAGGIGVAERLVLGGVAVGALGTSATGVVLALAPGEAMLRPAMFWLFGGLGTPAWSNLLVPAALCAVAFAWMRCWSERLDRLLLGQEVASSLGVDVGQTRRLCTAAAVLLTAACVAAAGLVGFVGLIAPHIARRFTGSEHRRAVPAAALWERLSWFSPMPERAPRLPPGSCPWACSPQRWGRRFS